MEKAYSFPAYDPYTQREYVRCWGICRECEKETVLYLSTSQLKLLCCECLPASHRKTV